MSEYRIGIMQGRLSSMDEGRIQLFSHRHWQDEFAVAARCGFDTIELVLDTE